MSQLGKYPTKLTISCRLPSPPYRLALHVRDLLPLAGRKDDNSVTVGGDKKERNKTRSSNINRVLSVSFKCLGSISRQPERLSRLCCAKNVEKCETLIRRRKSGEQEAVTHHQRQWPFEGPNCIAYRHSKLLTASLAESDRRKKRKRTS